MSLARTSIFAFTLLGIASGHACTRWPAPNPEVAPSSDGGEIAPRLVDSPPVSSPSWAVEISGFGKQCSASVLNEHWLLTAAHCLFDERRSPDALTVHYAPRPRERERIYVGPAELLPQPVWRKPYHSASAMPQFQKARWGDIGLVRLLGYGLDIGKTGQVKLYTDARRPWTYNIQNEEVWFSIAGWGRGSDPGGATTCYGDPSPPGVPSGVYRRVDGLPLQRTGNARFYVAIDRRSAHPCPGDSGGPWFFERGSATRETLQFAVTAEWRKDLSTGLTTDDRAALIHPHLPWIEATMRSKASIFPLECTTANVDGWQYRRCDERPRVRYELMGLANKCMEASALSDHAPVRLATCTPKSGAGTLPTHRQHWELTPSGEIRPQLDPRLCLHAYSTQNHTPMQLIPCSMALTQRFEHTAQGEIRLAYDRKMCVEVKGGFTDDGTPIQLYDCNGTASQVWRPR